MNNGGYYMLDMGGIPDIQQLAATGGSMESDIIPGLTAHIDECVKLGKPLMLCNMKWGSLTIPPVCGFVVLPQSSGNSYLVYVPGYRISVDREDTISVLGARFS